MSERCLEWDGCLNVRDLGGLRTRSGAVVRRGALVRADTVDRLSPTGWEALRAHGVKTVVDLRNDDERAKASPESLHMPLDGVEDRTFWDVWWHTPEFGTPYYYRPFLEHFPGRAAGVVQAIATAPPGGVLFHCQGGRDRTGLIAILVLAALDVEPAEIAEDYALSVERLPPEPELAAVFERRGRTPREAVLNLLDEIDVHEHLHGVDLDALKRRALV